MLTEDPSVARVLMLPGFLSPMGTPGLASSVSPPFTCSVLGFPSRVDAPCLGSAGCGSGPRLLLSSASHVLSRPLSDCSFLCTQAQLTCHPLRQTFLAPTWDRILATHSATSMITVCMIACLLPLEYELLLGMGIITLNTELIIIRTQTDT